MVDFLQAATVTSKTVKQTINKQSSNNPLLTSIPGFNGQVNLTSNLGSVLQSKTGSLTTNLNQTVGGINKTINGAVGDVTKAVSGVVGDVSETVDSVRSAIVSRLSVFEKSVSSLATGISPKLSSIFKNTNITTASTVSTQISDPVSTNLLNKRPDGTAFKVSGIAEGSQSANGNEVKFGTDGGSMTGASLGTLLNRFKQDVNSVKQLANNINRTLSGQSIKGMFNLNLNKLVNNTLSTIDIPSLSKDTKSAISTVVGVGRTTTTLTSTNDFNDFASRIQSLSKLKGNVDLSQYYTPSTGYSLIARDGTPILSGDSRPDASTANAITNMVSSVGCTLTNPEYLSADSVNSLFGLGLLMSSLDNLLDLVNDLLNCSHASTSLGQTSLKKVYQDVAPVNPSVAMLIVDKIENPEILGTRELGQQILTNPNLTYADEAAVRYMFTKMDLDPFDVLTVESASNDDYPVFSLTAVAAMNSDMRGAIFGDSVISDGIGGVSTSIGRGGLVDVL